MPYLYYIGPGKLPLSILSTVYRTYNESVAIAVFLESLLLKLDPLLMVMHSRLTDFPIVGKKV